jgi:hypothetical protein
MGSVAGVAVVAAVAVSAVGAVGGAAVVAVVVLVYLIQKVETKFLIMYLSCGLNVGYVWEDVNGGEHIRLSTKPKRCW